MNSGVYKASDAESASPPPPAAATAAGRVLSWRWVPTRQASACALYMAGTRTSAAMVRAKITPVAKMPTPQAMLRLPGRLSAATIWVFQKRLSQLWLGLARRSGARKPLLAELERSSQGESVVGRAAPVLYGAARGGGRLRTDTMRTWRWWGARGGTGDGEEARSRRQPQRRRRVAVRFRAVQRGAAWCRGSHVACGRRQGGVPPLDAALAPEM